MTKNTIIFQIAVFLLTALVPFQAVSQLKLPRLISDGMVLQRDADLNIWGWSTPEGRVHLHFLDTIYEVNANADGKWHVPLSGLKEGGPFDMMLTAEDTLHIKNILIGDVWVCSGQSQMDMDMNRVSPMYEKEIEQAGNAFIRYFSVPTVYNFHDAQEDLPFGNWEEVHQGNILRISAIAYFFADELYRQYGVPIGMIRSSLGGSPAEAWMSEDAIRRFPEHFKEAQKWKDNEMIRQLQQSEQAQSNVWFSTLNRLDRGYQDPDMPWHHPQKDVADWQEINIPSFLPGDTAGYINGSIWFRKDFFLDKDFHGKAAQLNLGRIVDADSVWVNGVFIGSVGYQYPPRRYAIPANVLREGNNAIVVRLLSHAGQAGFVPDKPYELVIGHQTFDLKGEWHYRLGVRMPAMAPQTFVRWKPTGLFNGMLAPLTSFTIKGVIWYQGESNTDRPHEYATLFPAMIQNWRDKWQQGDFPFLFVQLHNYMEAHNSPGESNWAHTRESQAQALALPNTAMAVAIDLGEWNDIHPLNKKDVAIRLALAARKTAYHEHELVASGPLFESMTNEDDRIIISFTNTGSGLTIHGGEKLKHFAIAGGDGKFVWANAKIQNNSVVVWSEQVRNPLHVRYAWADNPEGANLYNLEGLPAAPFRTDNW